MGRPSRKLPNRLRVFKVWAKRTSTRTPRRSATDAHNAQSPPLQKRKHGAALVLGWAKRGPRRLSQRQRCGGGMAGSGAGGGATLFAPGFSNVSDTPASFLIRSVFTSTFCLGSGLISVSKVW